MAEEDLEIVYEEANEAMGYAGHAVEAERLYEEAF